MLDLLGSGVKILLVDPSGVVCNPMTTQIITIASPVLVLGEGFITIASTKLQTGTHQFSVFGFASQSSALEIALVRASDDTVLSTISVTNTDPGLSNESDNFAVETEGLYNIRARATTHTGSGEISWVAIDQPSNGISGGTQTPGYILPDLVSGSDDSFEIYYNRFYIMHHLNWLASQVLELLNYPSEGRVFNEAMVWEHVGIKRMPAFSILWSDTQEPERAFATYTEEIAHYTVVMYANGDDALDKMLLITQMYSYFMKLIKDDRTAGGWAFNISAVEGLVSDEAAHNIKGQAAQTSIGYFTVQVEWVPGFWDIKNMRSASISLASPATLALTANTPDLIAGTYATQQNIGFTVGSNGELTYTASRAFSYLVQLSLSVTTPVPGVTTANIRVNGSDLPSNAGKAIMTGGAGQTVNLFCSAIVSLEKGAVVSFVIENTMGQTVTVESVNLTVSSLSLV